MQTYKPWYTSTSIQGSVITALGFVLSFVQQHYVVNISTADVTFYVSSVFSVIGIVMAIYGRAKATTILTK